MEFVTLPVLLAQIVNLLIIGYVLNRFLIQPLFVYLQKERRKILDLDEGLSSLKEEKVKMHQERDAVLLHAKQDADRLRQEMLAQARVSADSLVNDAKTEASRLKKQAQQDLEQQKNALITELETHVLQTALDLNARLFQTPEAHKDFLQKQVRSA